MQTLKVFCNALMVTKTQLSLGCVSCHQDLAFPMTTRSRDIYSETNV